MPKKNQPGCPCCSSCCNSFCVGQNFSPPYVNVIDPIYGTFRLNPVLTAAANQNYQVCFYSADVYFNFQGSAVCPPAQVPVHLAVGYNYTTNYGGPGPYLDIYLNEVPFSNTCGGNCPGLVTTFPVVRKQPGTWPGYLYGTAENGTRVLWSCKQTSPWNFSLTGKVPCYPPQYPIFANALYYLYGGICPPSSGYVSPTWKIVAGSGKNKTCAYYLTVATAICGLVAPGTITVTVQQNNASGKVLCTGTADANGNFLCAVPGPGLYYFSASTSAGGYSNQAVTVNVTSFANPVTVQTPIVPTTLTASGFWGEVTLKPGLQDPYYFPIQPGNSCTSGSAANIYIGTTTVNSPAECTCPATSVSVDFVFVLCGGAGKLYPYLLYCFPAYEANVVLLTYCPGTGLNQGTYTSGDGIQLSGTGPTGSGTVGYPIDLTGTFVAGGGLPQGILGGCGSCSGNCPQSVAVTQ